MTYKEINDLFMFTYGDPTQFPLLLIGITPYFDKIAATSPDPAEAFSRMSIGLHKLLSSYKPTKGTPMSVISTMCRNLCHNVYRDYKYNRIVFEDTQSVSFCNIGFDRDPVMEISEASNNEDLVDLIEASGLTEFQKNRLFEGSVPRLYSEEHEKTFNEFKDKVYKQQQDR
jgi:hypothetical protein